jgi:hypothetical protein
MISSRHAPAECPLSFQTTIHQEQTQAAIKKLFPKLPQQNQNTELPAAAPITSRRDEMNAAILVSDAVDLPPFET